MPLVPINRIFKSPLGLIFECCGIASAMLIIIDEIEVFMDFDIFAILEFDLLIGYLLDKLIQEKPSYGGLDEKLGGNCFRYSYLSPRSPNGEVRGGEVHFLVRFTSL